jgi:hypothetical protein
MPLLKLTPADILKSKVLEDSWYGLTCKSVSDWLPSADKQSTNCTVKFIVEDSDGKEIDYVINSKGMGFHTGLIAVMIGKSLQEVQKKPELLEADTDLWPGAKCDGHIVQDSYQGRANNKIAAFLPYGKGRAQAANSVY